MTWPSQVSSSADTGSSPVTAARVEVSEPADCGHLLSRREPSTAEFAGGPGNGPLQGEATRPVWLDLISSKWGLIMVGRETRLIPFPSLP